MSEPSDPLADITVRLGDLTLVVPAGQELRVAGTPGAFTVVVGPASTTSASPPARSALPSQASSSSTPSAALPDLAPESVSVAAAPAFNSAGWEAHLLACTTAAQCGSVDLGPHQAAANRLTPSTTSTWTSRARIARALRAGVGARLSLEGAPPIASPSIPFQNRFYVALACERYPRGFWCASYSRYSREVQGSDGARFATGSVSHAFATQTELEAYLTGARASWPVRLQQ